jgi:hypothetical protein
MNPFDLEQPLIELNSSTEKFRWTIRRAFEGVQIFGGIGSGKTSGSGRMIAHKYLTAGFGGLVLTVKPDEKLMWQEYCEKANRSHDLIVIEPEGKYKFNFLQYESGKVDGKESPTENIVEVLKTVIRAGEEKDKGKSDDPFWETALDMLIFNVIDLCKLAYGTVTINLMYEIVLTIPKGADEAARTEEKAFDKAMRIANEKINEKIDKWSASLSQDEKDRINNCSDEDYEIELFKVVPDVRLLKYIDQFFTENFITLTDKTRSIIDFSFSGFLFRFLREPIYSLFCRNESTVTPEDSLKGKIILINLPVKIYHKIGRDCQILFKYIWQRAMERRRVTETSLPVFLWADEAQNFLHEHDPTYQATARSSRIATVYISQNLPNYYSAMGGGKSEHKVRSFLGTLGTKIFHSNADTVTNTYASELIGKAYFVNESDQTSLNVQFSKSQTRSLVLESVIRPEEFVGMKTGGPQNSFKVEGIMHCQGDKLDGNANHKRMLFNQKY